MAQMKIGLIEILRAITASFVILIFALAPVFGLMYGTTCAISFGSFTVISPLELTLLSLSTKTILVSLIVPGLIAIFLIMIFGRFFCGWICPVGIIFENSHILTERKERKGVGVLRKNREKYAILLAILAASLLFNFTAPYLFSPPGAVYRIIIYLTLHGILGADITIILVLFILDLLAIRYGRTWCNTLCPLGTIISGLSVINIVKPKVDKKRCIDFDFNCLNCERVCPMMIPLTRADHWMMMNCHKCLKCWANCPVKAVEIKFFS